ncbi:MAG: hypothetical protein WCS97_02830 [Candidatus Paceibacterota bacterium]
MDEKRKLEEKEKEEEKKEESVLTTQQEERFDPGLWPSRDDPFHMYGSN